MALTIAGRPVRFSLGWLKPPPMPPDGNMTLFEHLRELRYRLVISAGAIIVGMLVCALFYNWGYTHILMAPFESAKAQLALSKPGLAAKMVSSGGIASPMTLAIKLVAVASLVFTSPVWLYQLWSFIMPGLLAREKKWAVIFVLCAAPLFVAGVVLGFYVMPKGISVLLSFTPEGADIENLVDINTFLSFMLRLMLVFGVAFLIPLVVLMLNFLGVIKARYLAKFRVYIIFACFVFGAVATPSTDPISMLALAVPMTVLFLASELIAYFNDKRRARRHVAGEVEDTVLARLQAEDAAKKPGDAAVVAKRASITSSISTAAKGLADAAKVSTPAPKKTDISDFKNAIQSLKSDEPGT